MGTIIHDIIEIASGTFPVLTQNDLEKYQSRGIMFAYNPN